MVLDSKTALQHLEELKNQYINSQSLRNLPVVMIDDQEDFDFILNKQGSIKRPFDPFRIPDILGQKK